MNNFYHIVVPGLGEAWYKVLPFFLSFFNFSKYFNLISSRIVVRGKYSTSALVVCWRHTEVRARGTARIVGI